MNELVLFGITGDLAKQKLIPALYNLYRTGKIDKKTCFIGFGRKKFSKVDFQNFIEQVIGDKNLLIKDAQKNVQKIKNASESAISTAATNSGNIREFSSQWSYIESELDNPSGYKKLASALMTDRTLVYISLPPMFQMQVCTQLVASRTLVKNTNRKLILEKPYGFDSVSATKLESFLTRRLSKNQILRVDHYAGKQALVELEEVANQGIFNDLLHKKNIRKIEIRIDESIDVSTRGSFYDGVGALNDVGQNHILHMLATILAIPEIGLPQRLSQNHSPTEHLPTQTLSKLRSDALSLVEVLRGSHKPILAQYQGYNTTYGVKEHSTAETFFRVFAKIKKTKANSKGTNGKRGNGKSTLSALSARWAGLQIELMGGKALHTAEASIVLFPVNKKMKPIKIFVNGYGKRDAYEQIFIDSFYYNSNRFIGFDQILRGWEIVESIKKMSKKSLVSYKKGSYPQDI
jgi:glucose-6-phosphate 1-dehydrogenase